MLGLSSLNGILPFDRLEAADEQVRGFNHERSVRGETTLSTSCPSLASLEPGNDNWWNSDMTLAQTELVAAAYQYALPGRKLKFVFDWSSGPFDKSNRDAPRKRSSFSKMSLRFFKTTLRSISGGRKTEEALSLP
jgi:hypothetical protein